MKLVADVVLTPQVISHIWERHHITADEVEDAAYGDIRVRRTRDGRVAVFGKTADGRYLMIFGLLMKARTLFVITAREMEDRERRYYLRRGK